MNADQIQKNRDEKGFLSRVKLRALYCQTYPRPSASIRGCSLLLRDGCTCERIQWSLCAGGVFRSAGFSEWRSASTRSSCSCLPWRSASVRWPDASTARVLTLWFLLLFAVVVREVARALAAAWYGLELRGILLLPTGGLMTYATLDATERAAQPAMQRRMAVIGPIASIGSGLLLGAIIGRRARRRPGRTGRGSSRRTCCAPRCGSTFCWAPSISCPRFRWMADASSEVAPGNDKSDSKVERRGADAGAAFRRVPAAGAWAEASASGSPSPW